MHRAAFAAALLSISVAEADKKLDDTVAQRRRVCDTAVRAARAAATCKLGPPGYTFESAREAYAKWRDGAPSTTGEREIIGRCAMGAAGYVAAAADAKCDLKLPRAEVAEVDAYLTVWFAARTTPRASGDAGVDKYLRDLAALRDRACACKAKDLTCLGAIGPLVDALPVPKAATAKAQDVLRTDGAALVDEIARCRQGLESGLYRPKQP